MADTWIQKIVVSCFESEPAYQLYCEPEGAVQDVEPGDVLTLTFAADSPHGFELSQVAGGIVLERQHALGRAMSGLRRRRRCGLGRLTVPGTEAGYVAGVSPRPRMARELASIASAIQSGIAVHT